MFAMQLQLFSHYFCWIFSDFYGCLANTFEVKEGNIYRCCWKRSRKKVGSTSDVVLQFFDDSLLFSFRYLVVYIEVCRHTQTDLRYFDSVRMIH